MESKPKNRCNSCTTIKLALFFIVTSVAVFILFDIQALSGVRVSSPFSSSPVSEPSSYEWKDLIAKTFQFSCLNDLREITSKLQDSVTFLPLKDLRFTDTAMEGHTWFMSSINDTHEQGELESLDFPSQASKGRVLCIAGNNVHDGGKNSYGLAWRDSLPYGATLMEGLTYISDTYYDYTNLWHGASAMAPFAGWYKKMGCQKPSRWVLYHQGELRTKMGSWVHNVMKAVFGEIKLERFEAGSGPFCFEKAVVMRHNLGKMAIEKKHEVFDQLRCKAREFCQVILETSTANDKETWVPAIRLTLLLRNGTRSFKNSSAVIQIFQNECARLKGCQLTVAQSEELSFCDQVKLMSATDIVASPHGAQLTNMFFMDRNSSIMEFFPNGWLELGPIGKYAHHWLASQSGMKHQGAWWDPQVDKKCPYADKDPRCFPSYKNGQIGHNKTFFTEWTRKVFNQVKTVKLNEISSQGQRRSSACACG